MSAPAETEPVTPMANTVLCFGEALIDMRGKQADGEQVGGALQFIPQPGGAPATCFALVSWEDGRAQFENPDHDFPQRITYSRDGDRLTATISDMTDTQVMQFGWDAVTD